MIKIPNSYGDVVLTDMYFSNLIGGVVTRSFGVVGMYSSGAAEGVRKIIDNRPAKDDGVRIYVEDGQLVIDLHVIVSYGVNMKTVVESIIESVSFAVEEATGIVVNHVRVHIDEVR